MARQTDTTEVNLEDMIASMTSIFRLIGREVSLTNRDGTGMVGKLTGFIASNLTVDTGASTVVCSWPEHIELRDDSNFAWTFPISELDVVEAVE